MTDLSKWNLVPCISPTSEQLGAVNEEPSPNLRVSTTYVWASGARATTALPVPFVATSMISQNRLKQEYSIPPELRVTHPKATQAVFGVEVNNGFSRRDLASFLDFSGLDPKAAEEAVVVGPMKEWAAAEAQLDMELIMGMAPGAPTTFFSIAHNKGDG